MKIFLAVLAIAIAIAVPVALFGGSTESYGISASKPLGDFATMDALFTSKGLKKSERALTRPEGFEHEIWEQIREYKVHEYKDFARQQSGVKHYAMIGVDDKGDVRFVGGSFFSRAKGYSDFGTKCETFLARFYAKVAGSKPVFAKGNEPGINVDEFLLAKFATPKAQGVWKKKPSSGNAQHGNTIWDYVLIYRR